MLHLLLYMVTVKRQLTICFKSSKSIQIGLCLLMSFSIHLDVRYGLTRHLSTQLRSGERTVVVGFCGQPQCCYRFYYPTVSFRSSSSYMVSGELFPDRLRPMSCNLHKWGLAQSPSCDCGRRQTMNHIVDTCPLTQSDGGLNLLHEADDDAVIWLESTATAALAK